MKAIFISDNNIRITDCKSPVIKNENEVLIKVKAVGLCGSDIQRIKKIQAGFIVNPPILGHEIAGEVAAIGSQVKKIKMGDRVVVKPLTGCMKCFFCKSGNYQLCTSLKSLGKNLDGGFAQYITVPENNLVKLDKKISHEEGTLLDPLAVCIHAMNIIGGLRDKKIAIIGDGTIGRICCELAEYYHVQNVTLIGKHIQEIDSNGLMTAINSAAKDKLSPLRNCFDVVFETVGRDQNTTLNLSIDLIKPMGKIIVLGVFPENYLANLNVRKLFIKEGSLTGSNSYGKKEFEEAAKILNRKVLSLQQLITHILPLSQFKKGVTFFENKQTSRAIKIVFIP